MGLLEQIAEDQFLILSEIRQLSLKCKQYSTNSKIKEAITLDDKLILEYEVYINSTEVQRILNVTAPVIYDWIRDGLLSTRDSDTKITNRFLLSEIEWLKNQNYRRLNTNGIRALIKKKSLEYRRIYR